MSDDCKNVCLELLKEIEKRFDELFDRIQKQGDYFANDIVIAKHLQTLMQKLDEAETIVNG